MGRNTNTHEISDFYMEFDLEVEYEVYPPVYGSPEPGSGGLYLGGPINLPEQIDIIRVLARVDETSVDITPLLSESDLISLEDEIIESRQE
jgi:hypothetical protein